MKKSFTHMALVVFALSFFLPTSANACFSCFTHHKTAVTYRGYANQYLQRYNQSYNHNYYTKYLYYNNQSNHYNNLSAYHHHNYNNNNYNNNNANANVNVNVNNNNCRVNTYRINSYKRYADNYNYYANRNLRLYRTTGRYHYKTSYNHYRSKCNLFRTKYRKLQNLCR